jgi:hypothetical protein
MVNRISHESFRWTGEEGVNSIGTSHEIYFASWNIDVLKTKQNHAFKAVWTNTGLVVYFVDVDMNSSRDPDISQFLPP